ncbi:MAG: GtrA family protein [Acidimicrobiales bacterium]
MKLSPPALRAWYETPSGRKAVRYSMVSVISVAVSQVVLFLTFGVLKVAGAVGCNIIATAVAAVPSYYLNRMWAWGKDGRSHLWKEVVPFWSLAFLGLAMSLIAVNWAAHWARTITDSHLGVALIVNVASLLAFGVLWVAKFLIFNKFVFIDHGTKEPVVASR